MGTMTTNKDPHKNLSTFGVQGKSSRGRVQSGKGGRIIRRGQYTHVEVMPKDETVRIDDKWRVLLPKSVRERLRMNQGDTLYLRVNEHGGIELRKAINPFDELAEWAIAEARAGRAKKVSDFARELGVDVES